MKYNLEVEITESGQISVIQKWGDLNHFEIVGILEYVKSKVMEDNVEDERNITLPPNWKPTAQV